jgi:hypothetical protein
MIPDYKKLREYEYRHHKRYEKYVEAEGLFCQDCGGSGGETEAILDDGTGPWFECGWCEGTGKVTKWLRGQWLKYRKDLKQGKYEYCD